MLTTEERRFLRDWEIQRKDGKRAYFLLYIIVGSIVGTIGVFFIMSMIHFGRPKLLWPVPVISFILTCLYTVISWNRSEKKWKKLIRKVIEQNKGV
jgi:ABC-type bacteriocin/lantibiotic exporter with double-glycine peptidase domain